MTAEEDAAHDSPVSKWLLNLAAERKLGSQGLAVVHALATRPDYSSFASTSDIAQQSGVDPSTVTRTSRALGFTGWPAFRLEIRTRLHSAKSASQLVQEQTSNLSDPAMRAITMDIENLAALARSPQTDTIASMAKAIVNAERTLVIGSGSYAAPAIQLAHTASVMGRDVRFSDRGGTALVNSVLQLGPADCLVAFSFWRIPKELLEVTRIAKNRGVDVCIVTDLRYSRFAELGSKVLTVPTDSAGYFPSLTACTAIVNAVTADMLDIARDEAIRHLREVEEAWKQLDLSVDYSI